MARLVVIATREGEIIDLEGDVSEILGWNPAELVGLSVTTIIPFKYRERHAAGWERWTKTGVKGPWGLGWRFPLDARMEIRFLSPSA